MKTMQGMDDAARYKTGMIFAIIHGNFPQAPQLRLCERSFNLPLLFRTNSALDLHVLKCVIGNSLSPSLR